MQQACVIGYLAVLWVSCLHAQELGPERVTLSGTAKGGTLILGTAPGNWVAKIVSVELPPKQESSSAAESLRAKSGAKGKGSTIILHGGIRRGKWFFAGSESGLGIPQAPYFLTASFDFGEDRILLRWRNRDKYDTIAICHDGVFIDRVHGKQTTYELRGASRRFNLDLNDTTIHVVAYRNSIPSNVAIVLLSGERLEEMASSSFAGGVAPNWTASRNQAKLVEFSEGKKLGSELSPNVTYSTPGDRPNYQAVTIRKGGEAKLQRSFLKMPAGTYKVSLRVNTFKAAKGNWSAAIKVNQKQIVVQPTSEKWMKLSTSVAVDKAQDIDVNVLLKNGGEPMLDFGIDWVAIQKIR